jgi:hypothetical protein
MSRGVESLNSARGMWERVERGWEMNSEFLNVALVR